MCARRRRRPRGGGGPGAGAQGLPARRAALEERPCRAAPRPPPAPELPADAAPSAPTHGARPSLGPKPPPGAGRGKAAPRSRLRLLHSGRGNFRPHRAAQRPAPAAEGTAQARAGLEGPGQAAGKERGRSAGLGTLAGRGKLTDLSAKRRGGNASRARESPQSSPIVARSKRLQSSLPHIGSQLGASRALSRQPAAARTFDRGRARGRPRAPRRRTRTSHPRLPLAFAAAVFVRDGEAWTLVVKFLQ